MNVILKHMLTDKNAPAHAALGMVCGGCATIIIGLVFSNFILTVLTLLLAPMYVGVVIELAQRAERSYIKDPFTFIGFTGPHQNSFKESVLDVFQTWWYPVTFYIRWKHKDKAVS